MTDDVIDDLACMKLSAIAGRGLARDFWDLHELIVASGRSLPEMLAAFRRKYPVQPSTRRAAQRCWIAAATGSMFNIP